MLAVSSGRVEKSSLTEQMQEPESSWNEYCSKKERDSAEFLGDMPRTAQVLAMAVVATEPVDKLSARLQHLDAHSDSLREVLDDERGPIRECQRHLWQRRRPRWGRW